MKYLSFRNKFIADFDLSSIANYYGKNYNRNKKKMAEGKEDKKKNEKKFKFKFNEF